MSTPRDKNDAPAILYVCSTCRPERAGGDRDALARAIRNAGLAAEVRAQACMNACSAPGSLALQGYGRATYFFTGIDPDVDRDDIVATIGAYLATESGWIEDARICGRLRHCLAGRVPAISSGS
jgi:predicted metal-binding protein